MELIAIEKCQRKTEEEKEILSALSQSATYMVIERLTDEPGIHNIFPGDKKKKCD